MTALGITVWRAYMALGVHMAAAIGFCREVYPHNSTVFKPNLYLTGISFREVFFFVFCFCLISSVFTTSHQVLEFWNYFIEETL